MLKQKIKEISQIILKWPIAPQGWNEVPFHFLSSSPTAFPCLPFPSSKCTYTKLNSKV